MRFIALCFLSLVLAIPTAGATVLVKRFPNDTPVAACVPSDSNSNCGGGSVTEIDPLSLHLNQNGTPQTVFNGAPTFTGLLSNGSIQIGTTGTAYNLDMRDTDVTHGITTVAHTNTYGLLKEINATKGGLFVDGFSDGSDNPAIELRGFMVSDPDDGVPAVIIDSYSANGTGTKALASGKTLLSVQNNGSEKIQVLGDGTTTLRKYTTDGFVKFSGSAGTLAVDTNTYLTSLSGAVLTDQTSPQSISASPYFTGLENISMVGTDENGALFDNTANIITYLDNTYVTPATNVWTKTGTTLAPTTAGDRVLCGGVTDDTATPLQTKNLYISGINGTTTTTGADMTFYTGGGATDANGKGNRGGNINIGAGGGGASTASQPLNANASGGSFSFTGGPGGYSNITVGGNSAGGKGSALSFKSGYGGWAGTYPTGNATGGIGGAVVTTGESGGNAGFSQFANFTAGNMTGGAGGAISSTAGNGGSAQNSSATNKGGNAGAVDYKGGAGGNATGTGGTSAIGGNGSTLAFLGGNGGTASGASVTNTNGNGGGITFRAGTAGAGGTGGTNGTTTINDYAGNALVQVGATASTLGLYGVTPVAKPTTAIAGATYAAVGGGAIQLSDTYGGYTIAQIVAALKAEGLLA